MEFDTDSDRAGATVVPVPLPVFNPSHFRPGFALRLKQFTLAEIRPFWEAVSSVWFWATIAILAFLFIGAFQFSFTKIFDLDAPRDRPYLVDYYATERYQDFVYRWAKPSSNIVLRGIGQIPHSVIRLELSDRPPGSPTAQIELLANSSPVANFQVDQPRKIYQFEYNAASRPILNPKETELNFWMKTDTLLVRGDKRPLGIVVSKIEIQEQGLFQTGRPVIPDWPLVLKLLACLAVFWILGKRAGWSAPAASLGVFWFGLLVVAGLILDRPTVALAGSLMVEAALLSYVLAVLGLRYTGWWLQRKGLSFGVEAGRWLAIIFALAYFIRIVGMNHPSFQTLDHGFRIHEVAAISDDPSLLITRYYNINSVEGIGGQGRGVELGQWGIQISVPYSPLFYIFDMPVNWLTHQEEAALLHWTNNYAAWMDVSALFFLFIVACQTLGRFGQMAGIIGALLYCFFPLSYLMVSDGGYTTILANWLTLAWLMVLTGWFVGTAPARPRRWAVFGTGVLLGLAFLAHTAAFMLVGAWMAVFLGYWWLVSRRQSNYPFLWRRVALMYVIGVGLAIALYYGFHVADFLKSTLPTMAGEIGKGQQIGAQALTLRGFWQSLQAHFHLVPFFVTVGALAWPTTTRLLGKKLKLAQPQSLTNEEINPPSLLLYLSWLTTFLLFSIIATKVNLLQKHMLFALPLFALGVGLGLAFLLDFLQSQARSNSQSRPARLQPEQAIWIGGLIISAVAIWILVAGSYTWYIRVINYILPAGTG